MKLFTKDINQKLFAQYRIGSNLNNQKVVAKIFNPYGEGRWYLLNSDPNDPDYLWAIVKMGDEVEIGSVSRRELESIRIKPFGLPLERDMYFNDRNAMEVLDGLEKGQTFAAGGMTPGRYYKDNSGNELRYIGESQGKLLFKDGEKIVYKDESDFNEDSPKERGLFGFFEEGGEINFGEDLGDGFSVGNDVYITDSKSMYKGKTGFVSGLAGKDLLVTFSENGNERSVVVSKKGVEKLDAPMADGGTTKRTVKLTLSDKDSYDYTYKQDGATASITFGFGKEPFQYEVKKISKSLEPLKQDILDAFTIQGIKQHEYKGGFSEAIKHLDTKVVYEDNMAKGGETKINLGVDKNGKSYKVGDIISLRAYMYEIMKDDDGKIILSQLDSYYAPFGKNYQVGSPQFNDILKQGVIFSNRKNNMAKGGKVGDPISEEELKKLVERLSKKDKLDMQESYALSKAKYNLERINKGKMAKGGEVKFEDKVKAIKESLLKRKKVSPKVQKDYGKTYSPKEAEESAKRIAASQRMKYELKKKFKKGGKTIAQTPAPKKDRVFGSSTNKAGSASSKKSASNIELNESIVKTLGEKAKAYNEKHSSKVSTSTLKAVMRRGMGAFSTSHRPGMTRQGWGYARVNKFLQKKGGAKVKAAYVQDDDLL